MAWEVAQGILLAVAILVAIPFVMIFLARGARAAYVGVKKHRRTLVVGLGVGAIIAVFLALASNSATRGAGVAFGRVIGICLLAWGFYALKQYLRPKGERNLFDRDFEEEEKP